MQEELDDTLMYLKGFGKGQCFTNKAPPALAQGVVEALHVICRTPFGVAGLMVAGRQDIVIALLRPCCATCRKFG